MIEKYRLVKSRRKTLSVSVKGGIVEVKAPIGLSEIEIERFLLKHSQWIEKKLKESESLKKDIDNEPKLSMDEIRKLANEALKVVPERVAYYAGKMHVTYGRITIRNQKSRWGSCTSKGNLNFNCLLMLAPREVLDSVVVHELCHRKHMDHSKRFYEDILKVYPDYYKWDAWLKENGKKLIGRMLKE